MSVELNKARDAANEANDRMCEAWDTLRSSNTHANQGVWLELTKQWKELQKEFEEKLLQCFAAI